MDFKHTHTFTIQFSMLFTSILNVKWVSVIGTVRWRPHTTDAIVIVIFEPIFTFYMLLYASWLLTSHTQKKNKTKAPNRKSEETLLISFETISEIHSNKLYANGCNKAEKPIKSHYFIKIEF